MLKRKNMLVVNRKSGITHFVRDDKTICGVQTDNDSFIVTTSMHITCRKCKGILRKNPESEYDDTPIDVVDFIKLIFGFNSEYIGDDDGI